MQELELLQTYLVRLRQERLQQSHATLVSELNDEALRHARTMAFEADLVGRILSAVKDLEKDPGLFIQNHLKPI